MTRSTASLGLPPAVLLLAAALAQPAPPVLTVAPLLAGCPGELSLSGAPGASFVIAMDTGPGPVFVPGLGVVHLDLGPGFAILLNGPALGMVLDPTGSFVLPVAIPPAISVPLTLHFQAAVIGTTGTVLSIRMAATITAPPPVSWQAAPVLIPAEDLLCEDGRFVDVDGDGDQDLVVANSGSATGLAARTRLYINQGGLQGGTAGTFIDETLREDWPDVRPAAEARIRTQVSEVAEGDGRAVVIPFRVWGFGPTPKSSRACPTSPTGRVSFRNRSSPSRQKGSSPGRFILHRLHEAEGRSDRLWGMLFGGAHP